METPRTDRGYSVAAYFGLLRSGALSQDDRVELLDGVIVAEPPMDPPHASGISYVSDAVRRAVGDRALVRVQAPLVANPFSVPEPDLAVVAGDKAAYLEQHPTTALLVIEVSDSSLAQDRLSKSRIYAGAVARRGEAIALVALPDAVVAVDALLPPRR